MSAESEINVNKLPGGDTLPESDDLLDWFADLDLGDELHEPSPQPGLGVSLAPVSLKDELKLGNGTGPGPATHLHDAFKEIKDEQLEPPEQEVVKRAPIRSVAPRSHRRASTDETQTSFEEFKVFKLPIIDKDDYESRKMAAREQSIRTAVSKSVQSFVSALNSRALPFLTHDPLVLFEGSLKARMLGHADVIGDAQSVDDKRRALIDVLKERVTASWGRVYSVYAAEGDLIAVLKELRMKGQTLENVLESINTHFDVNSPKEHLPTNVQDEKKRGRPANALNSEG